MQHIDYHRISKAFRHKAQWTDAGTLSFFNEEVDLYNLSSSPVGFKVDARLRQEFMAKVALRRRGLNTGLGAVTTRARRVTDGNHFGARASLAGLFAMN